MSIVEKALDKLHKAQPAARESTVPITRRNGVAVEREVPAARTPQVPEQHTTIDVEALRELGVMPPKADSRRVIEECRRIKWPLLAAAFARGVEAVPLGNLIMITSALPSEGKTFTTMNLALNIAQERDCTLLLVDADVAKAHLTEALGLQDHPGLLDVIADETLSLESVIHRTQIDGLSVVPAGRASPRAAELLASRRMVDLLQLQAERVPNRVILFDSSPVLATNEAQVLARICGQVVMIVRADYTSQSAVHEAISLLDRSKSISCVLTHAKGEPGREYYGAYGRYYGDAGN